MMETDNRETTIAKQPLHPVVEGPSEAKRQRKAKGPEILTREPGKSLLPHARVQKILKADKVRAQLASWSCHSKPYNCYRNL